jgi:molybdate transport system substrate-binding protein
MRLILASLMLLFASAPAAAEDPVRLFAASSLTEAVNDIADLYARAGHPRPVIVLAASSALARQIDQGAPADVFLSADEAWMDTLARQKRIAPATRRDLLTNRLVLIVPSTSKARIAIRPGFAFATLIGDSRWATGDPDAVPVGKYAREALIALKVWDQVSGKLARAENVRAALAFVERGDVTAGVVYETDARATAKVRIAGVFPASSHKPITYPVAATASAGAQAAPFLAFLKTGAAKAAFRARGFGVK